MTVFRVLNQLCFALLTIVSINVSANSLSSQVSFYDDENIVSVYGTTNVTDSVSVNAEIDSTGYLALGAGYGEIFGSWYLEGFFNYGRADLIDILDLGIMAGTSLSEKVTVFYLGYHQWRETNGIPGAIGSEVFNAREWQNTIGFSYEPSEVFEISVSLSHDRLLSGHWLVADVENKNINSQDVTFKYKTRVVNPFVRYRTGEYRVRPGEPITRDDTFEFGVSASF